MFTAVFRLFCSCCLRDKSADGRGAPDETSRLIPVDPDPHPNPPQHDHAFDQQQVLARLGDIVRVTERKMVNVTAHLPFNLHNPGSSRSQSSRSARGPCEHCGEDHTAVGAKRPSLGASPGPSMLGDEDRPLLNARLVPHSNVCPPDDCCPPNGETSRGRARMKEGDNEDPPVPELDVTPADPGTSIIDPNSTPEQPVIILSSSPAAFNFGDTALSMSWGD